MIIADSNTVINCINVGKDIPSDLLVSDDLYDEYLMIEIRHDEKIANVARASAMENYDEAYFIQKYAEALNTYRDFSFAKSRGFADISIIALVACIVEDFGRQTTQLSLNLEDQEEPRLNVITGDGSLRKELETRFGSKINLMQFEDLP